MRKNNNICKHILGVVAYIFTSLALTESSQVKASSDTNNLNVNFLKNKFECNTLNTHSAGVVGNIKATVDGVGPNLKLKYENVPNDGKKVIAVLVDDIMGGGFDYAFLDDQWTVEFKNIPPYIKQPQVHLYTQNPEDPDFLLHEENFIAKSYCLMPSIIRISNNGGYDIGRAPALDGDSKAIADCNTFGFLTTTAPDLYCVVMPFENVLNHLPGGDSITVNDIFGVVIAEDSEGKPLQVNAVNMSNYSSTDGPIGKEGCRFEFLLPQDATQLQLHLYKNELLTENYLCKFFFKIEKKAAKNYTDFNKWH